MGELIISRWQESDALLDAWLRCEKTRAHYRTFVRFQTAMRAERRQRVAEAAARVAANEGETTT
jgi:hypothetical protein